MSILSGASVSQLLALSSVPCGARITRMLSSREGRVMAQAFRNLSSSTPRRSERGEDRGADRINDGPAVHEAGRRDDVGMKVTVVFQARNLATEQGPDSFKRRARREGAMKVASLGGGEELNADDRRCVISHRRQPPRAMRSHRDVILLVGRGRNGIDAGWMGEGLVLGDQGGGGHLRNHEPGIEPGLRGQKRWQCR